jgi:hypothetical protein
LSSSFRVYFHTSAVSNNPKSSNPLSLESLFPFAVVAVVVLAEEVTFPHPLSLAGVLPHPLSLAVFPVHPLSLVAVVLPQESKAVEVPAGAVKGLPFVEVGTNDEDEVVGADDEGNAFGTEGVVKVFPVEGVENDGKAFDEEEVVVEGAVVDGVVVDVVVDGVVEDHGSEVNPANPPIAELEDPIFVPLEAPAPAAVAPPAPAPPKELVVIVLAHGSSKEEKFRPVAGEADPPMPMPIPVPMPMPMPMPMPIPLAEPVVELVVGVNELSNCIPPTVEEGFPCPSDPIEDFPCPSDPVEEILFPCASDPDEERFVTP